MTTFNILYNRLPNVFGVSPYLIFKERPNYGRMKSQKDFKYENRESANKGMFKGRINA
jgi:hypothetical protein